MGDSVELRNKSDKKTKPKMLNRLSKNSQLRRTSRQESIGAIEELVQCGICLEKLSNSRMLPCQHTFCLTCLQSHLVAKNLVAPSFQPSSPDQTQTATSNNSRTIKCPICQHKIHLEKGLDSLEALPRNLYIDSLLKVVEGNLSPSSSKPPDYRCAKCQTFSQGQERCCQHCVQIFCNVCWNEHLSELEATLSTLMKQVEESQVRLDHKLEIFEDRCDQLNEKITEATEQKISDLRTLEARVLEDVVTIKNEGRVAFANINEKIGKMQEKLVAKSFGKGDSKVTTFMALHGETSTLLKEVNHFGEARVIFDPENFTLDQDTEGVYNDVEEPETINGSRIGNPLESVDAMTQYYKTRSFTPKLIWNKCPRPAHVGVPPWDNTLLYIAATDTHTVLILKRDRGKLEGRLTSPDMLCPLGIAFSKMRQEIYISDKWQHCIHVFASSGEYLRKICSKGNGEGRVRSPDGIAVTAKEELVICDSGNDRIVIVDPRNGQHLGTIGVVNKKTKLNMPMGVAVFDEKIVVADTGNHRIKVFNFKGDTLLEFGALGRAKGQFRSAEIVAVDPLGFILVGDGGNARVQVFKPDGTLVKVFGGNGFGWVSGICVTPDLDIITTDSKTRCLRIF